MRSCALRVVSAIAGPLASSCASSLGGLFAGRIVSAGLFFGGGGIVSIAAHVLLAGGLVLYQLRGRRI